MNAPDGMKLIPGCNGFYAASEDGRIFSIRRGKFLRPANNRGYLFVSISINNKHKCLKVHRLVLSAWLPNVGNLPQVNHINGIKHDNRVENLEWSDARSQQIHARKLGLIVTSNAAKEASRRNIKHQGKKARSLSYEDAKQIRMSSCSCMEMARIYSVSKSAIHAIRKGKTYVSE